MKYEIGALVLEQHPTLNFGLIIDYDGIYYKVRWIWARKIFISHYLEKTMENYYEIY